MADHQAIMEAFQEILAGKKDPLPSYTQETLIAKRNALKKQGKKACAKKGCPCEAYRNGTFCLAHFMQDFYGEQHLFVTWEAPCLIVSGLEYDRSQPWHELFEETEIRLIVFQGCHFPEEYVPFHAQNQVVRYEYCTFSGSKSTFYLSDQVMNCTISGNISFLGKGFDFPKAPPFVAICQPPEIGEAKPLKIEFRDVETDKWREDVSITLASERGKPYQHIDFSLQNCVYQGLPVRVRSCREQEKQVSVSFLFDQCRIEAAAFGVDWSQLKEAETGAETGAEADHPIGAFIHKITLRHCRVVDDCFFHPTGGISCVKTIFEQRVLCRNAVNTDRWQQFFLAECHFLKSVTCENLSVASLYWGFNQFDHPILCNEMNFHHSYSLHEQQAERVGIAPEEGGMPQGLFGTEPVYWDGNIFTGPVSLQGACVPRDFQLSGNFFAGAIDSAGIRAQAGKKPLPDFDQESCRLLKVGAERSGDMLGSHRYFAEEMSQYHQKSKMPLSEKFVMAWNYYTSNFGQDYVTPILWILLLVVVGYLGLGNEGGRLFGAVCGAETPSSNSVYNFLSWYLPTNFAFITCPDEWSNWRYAVMMIIGICQAVLTWNALVALKRKVKR